VIAAKELGGLMLIDALNYLVLLPELGDHQGTIIFAWCLPGSWSSKPAGRVV
jgi:hypothetical protein